MAVYELTPQDHEGAEREERPAGRTLPESLLMENELWCCRFRWMVVAVMLLFGTLSFFPSVFRPPGFRTQLWWPFVVAGVATAANIVFLWHAGQFSRDGDGGGAALNIWGQIGVDLLLLTAVVHYAGSVETYISFAYLFHIILACIFFSRRKSLLVTVLAALLFTACVELESAGILSVQGVYARSHIREAIDRQPLGVHLSVFSAVAIWFVVWYLASALSAMVRQRDQELAEANVRLQQAQEERTRHMLRTTHELKAPFTAIMANTQLLLEGHCGELSEEARDVITRIKNRSDRLATEIQEMLQLANLHSESTGEKERTEVDLAEVAGKVVEEIRNIADEKDVSIETELEPAPVVGSEEQIEMLFHNLVSNAVYYSNEGGNVTVATEGGETTGPTAVVRDDGIGIPEEKLPSIFDEYYRTNEAVKHHKESTGLGLAIVKRVAQEHGARIKVDTAPGRGTAFMLSFPGRSSTPDRNQKET